LCYGGPGFNAEGGPEFDADYQLVNTTMTDLARAAEAGLAELRPGNSGATAAGTPIRNQSRREGRKPAIEGSAMKGNMRQELEPGQDALTALAEPADGETGIIS
jgi:hypothetical protein